MKKVLVMVSVILAMLFTVLGVRNVSANNSLPSYCVVLQGDYGADMRNKIYNLIESKVTGDMESPVNTENALMELTDSNGTYDPNKLGIQLCDDYVVLVTIDNDTSYDEVLHNVKIHMDVMEVGTKKMYTKFGNVIVPAMSNPEDEVINALENFLDDEDNAEIK